jgi:hypothetical protein
MKELAPYMRGWRSYFGFYETPVVLIYLTRWVRLRLRLLCGASGKGVIRPVTVQGPPNRYRYYELTLQSLKGRQSAFKSHQIGERWVATRVRDTIG